MPSTINASTSAGLVNTADTSGVLALQTAGTTAVSISASQVVTLTNALPVASGGSGVTTSTGTGANVLGTTPSFTSTIGVGAATASASGAGISFPATQSASSDANTLDDYEEGTWTPSVGGTATYTTQLGRYTKIGNKVFIEGVISINTIGTGSVGDISGLPFTTNASSPLGSISVGFYSVSATSITYISATLAAGQNNINLRVQGNAGGSMGAVTFFQNSATIYFTGQYTA